MLEAIRRQLINRFLKKREGNLHATWDICPHIRKKLEKVKDGSRPCICEWSDVGSFEVDNLNEGCNVVNIINRTCTYGRRQLNGIPCSHACPTLCFDQRTPKEYVDVCYRKAATIHTIQSFEDRQKARVDETLTQRVRIMLGRPRKARVHAEDEP